MIVYLHFFDICVEMGTALETSTVRILKEALLFWILDVGNGTRKCEFLKRSVSWQRAVVERPWLNVKGRDTFLSRPTVQMNMCSF